MGAGLVPDLFFAGAGAMELCFTCGLRRFTILFNLCSRCWRMRAMVMRKLFHVGGLLGLTLSALAPMRVTALTLNAAPAGWDAQAATYQLRVDGSGYPGRLSVGGQDWL